MSSPSSSIVTSGSVLKWLRTLLLPYRWQVVGAIAALLVASAAWLILGQGIKIAVDRGLIEDNADILNRAVVGVLIITTVASVATYARFYLMTWLGERISADIRLSVYTHLLTLPPSFFARQRTGEVISRFTSDTAVLQTVVGMSLSMAIRSTITFVGALTLMVFTSPTLTFCVLLAVPAVLIPIRILAPQVRRYAKQSQDTLANLGAHIDQSLHEISTVQAFNAQATEVRLFTSGVNEVMNAAQKRIHYRSMLIGLIMLLSIGAIVVIAWFGARQVFSQEMTVGELSAFLFYAIMAGGSIATISEVIGEVQRGVGASERLLELLATESSIEEGLAHRQVNQHTPPSISIENVHFSYPDARPLFTDLTLHIAAGEKVALVGASGAGKTTLFQLLMRFYDIQQGQICLDHEPITSQTLDSLRAHIAIVTQEPVVFAGTVMENIRYGRPNASNDDVKRAARSAFAHEFIDELDAGYHTQLGERGVRLSGGQKQRIAIARALLANRPILLLDEATSALDARSEKMVQEALNKLMQGRTTIIIAHRLATVRHVDRIVVMDRGCVINTGKHDELMENDALYREYAELQLLS
ncbi:ABC transporter transmembrane domain-containing protein [Aestuariibacter sp. A3R04]|uniref:ABC transporter transmembrane domain-containing protein n=1 Tax=Aestuariibacter sp. A3R04 TaxID=2841571 RepID=UPI001C08AE18|nr:ABC transporter transmembrane domain-containing protein [Aestuariibacter sp. A3R04]MBU3022419.1 ATP-binding cassette domain-containing protein [Aestuariibacter sp. A3R04]